MRTSKRPRVLIEHAGTLFLRSLKKEMTRPERWGGAMPDAAAFSEDFRTVVSREGHLVEGVGSACVACFARGKLFTAWPCTPVGRAALLEHFATITLASAPDGSVVAAFASGLKLPAGPDWRLRWRVFVLALGLGRDLLDPGVEIVMRSVADLMRRPLDQPAPVTEASSARARLLSHYAAAELDHSARGAEAEWIFVVQTVLSWLNASLGDDGPRPAGPGGRPSGSGWLAQLPDRGTLIGDCYRSAIDLVMLVDLGRHACPRCRDEEPAYPLLRLGAVLMPDDPAYSREWRAFQRGCPTRAAALRAQVERMLQEATGFGWSCPWPGADGDDGELELRSFTGLLRGTRSPAVGGARRRIDPALVVGYWLAVRSQPALRAIEELIKHAAAGEPAFGVADVDGHFHRRGRDRDGEPVESVGDRTEQLRLVGPGHGLAGVDPADLLNDALLAGPLSRPELLFDPEQADPGLPIPGEWTGAGVVDAWIATLALNAARSLLREGAPARDRRSPGRAATGADAAGRASAGRAAAARRDVPHANLLRLLSAVYGEPEPELGAAVPAAYANKARRNADELVQGVRMLDGLGPDGWVSYCRTVTGILSACPTQAAALRERLRTSAGVHYLVGVHGAAAILPALEPLGADHRPGAKPAANLHVARRTLRGLLAAGEMELTDFLLGFPAARGG